MFLHSVFDGRALYATAKVGPFGYLDATGAVAIEPAFAPPPSASVAPDMQFSEGLAAARRASDPDAGWGYIDTAGTWVIEPQFTRGGRFQDGVAKVQKDGAWRWIDILGKPLSIR